MPNIRMPRSIPELTRVDMVRWRNMVLKGHNGECWIWTGARTLGGYGQFRLRGHFSKFMAHRVGYRWFRGEIPRGKLLLHMCDNPSCVNPEHLSAGSYLENFEDMIEKGRAPFWLRMKMRCPF